MMWRNVDLFSATSNQRWLKGRMMNSWELIPPPFRVFRPADVFSLTYTKGLCFCFQAWPFLRGHRSCWSQGEAVTANVQTFDSHRSVMETQQRLHRRLTVTSRKDLLSICWCGWEHTANTLILNYSGCLSDTADLTLEPWTYRLNAHQLKG